MYNRRTSTLHSGSSYAPVSHFRIFGCERRSVTKKALRSEYPDIGSSHADEALAASFGFKTHASMLHILRQVDVAARMIVGADHVQLAVPARAIGLS